MLVDVGTFTLDDADISVIDWEAASAAGVADQYARVILKHGESIYIDPPNRERLRQVVAARKNRERRSRV